MSIHQLVIQNLEILEQAPAIARDVDETVMRAVDRKLAKWAGDQKGWWVEEDCEDDFCSFGPENWPYDAENDEYAALYQFGSTSENDDEEYEYYVSALTGAVQQEFGIWFHVEPSWIKRHLKKKATASWQRFLSEQLTKRESLVAYGFRHIKGGLFLPLKVSATELANTYPDALEDALSPIDKALEKLKAAHREINEIVQSAVQELRLSTQSSES